MQSEDSENFRTSFCEIGRLVGEGLEELEAVRKVFHNLQPSDSPCSSQADILLACILNTPSPSQSFVQSLDPLILKVMKLCRELEYLNT